MSAAEEIKIEPDFILLRFQNDTNETQRFEKQVKTGLIQFHFNVKGKGKFIFKMLGKSTHHFLNLHHFFLKKRNYIS